MMWGMGGCSRMWGRVRKKRKIAKGLEFRRLKME
jgi:hypothetical protein